MLVEIRWIIVLGGEGCLWRGRKEFVEMIEMFCVDLNCCSRLNSIYEIWIVYCM